MIAIEEMFAHSGHNSDRPCGHSSLICAVDAEIAVKRDPSETMVATLESLKRRGSRRGNCQPARSRRGRRGSQRRADQSATSRRAARDEQLLRFVHQIERDEDSSIEMPTFVDEPVLGCGA